MPEATASGGLTSTCRHGCELHANRRARGCHVAHTLNMCLSASFYQSEEAEIYSMVLHQVGVVAISARTEPRRRAGCDAVE